MRKVAISEFRQHLPEYLEQVRKGEPLQITQHGKVVARVTPDEDVAAAARNYIAMLRKTARVGDVISPIGEPWESERGGV
jgi:prevent-host-death family protein